MRKPVTGAKPQAPQSPIPSLPFCPIVLSFHLPTISAISDGIFSCHATQLVYGFYAARC